MKKLVLVYAISIMLAGAAFAQDTDTTPLSEHPTSSQFSPFFHLFPFGIIPQKATVEHLQCPDFLYFDQNGTDMTYDEPLPSSRWAVLVTAPITYPTDVSKCTVWTVTENFVINGMKAETKDTIMVFIREATGSYNQIYSTHFIARPGENQGELEIDPQSFWPGLHAVISPKRNVYVGYYIKPDTTTGQTVTWYFKTPALFTSPPIHSVRFYQANPPNGAWTVQTASSVVGSSVDWPVAMKMCCDYPVPVELSLFQGSIQNGFVLLKWKTQSETNNQSFEVLRSWSPEGSWESRGVVPGHGTTTAEQTYDFKDPIPTGSPPAAYYRLRQRDFDGTEKNLPPIRVSLHAAGGMQFALLPSYPNPLLAARNSHTTIRYQLPASDQVRVSVYDPLGREVARLMDAQQPAGFHEVQWHPNEGGFELKSGAYVVQIRSGANTAIQKIALVK
jgi:hypothetical protein